MSTTDLAHLPADTVAVLPVYVDAGIQKTLIFNSHGGPSQVMDIVARELRVRHGIGARLLAKVHA